MPRTNARIDIRVEKAVGFLQRCPNLTVPEAMKLANFMPQEVACQARRMWIYRRWNKLAPKNMTFPTPPPQQITFSVNSDNSNNDGRTLSSMTDSGSNRPSPKKEDKVDSHDCSSKTGQ